MFELSLSRCVSWNDIVGSKRSSCEWRRESQTKCFVKVITDPWSVFAETILNPIFSRFYLLSIPETRKWCQLHWLVSNISLSFFSLLSSFLFWFFFLFFSFRFFSLFAFYLFFHFLLSLISWFIYSLFLCLLKSRFFQLFLTVHHEGRKFLELKNVLLELFSLSPCFTLTQICSLSLRISFRKLTIFFSS